MPQDGDARLHDDARPFLNVEGVFEVEVDAACVLDLLLSFVDVDVDVILFSDVDLDDDEPIEVFGKVPDVHVKFTVLRDLYVEVVILYDVL